ncbi:MAG: nucleoside-diphosphate kinase [Candidatus Diapherotrites archaeon]|nr:nucleoside-diphosphate kinase [Candidatus Diapherotrites archaeon]
MERTLIIVKPDAVQRGLVGEIVKRFEDKGLKIVAMKLEVLAEEKLKEHYAHHSTKPFFPELVNFMKSTPSVLMVLEGTECVRVIRQMLGATNGRDATSGTLRGDYSISNQNNLVHASESLEAAEKEIARFFKKEEVMNYTKTLTEWFYASKEKN